MKNSGFTLVELLITIVVIAIVTSVAVPSYQQHVLRSQRGDATAALLLIAAQQEKWYLQNNTYSTSLTDLGVTDTANKFYTLSIDSADSFQFVATASVDSTGPQKADKKCKSFTLDSAGARTAKDSDNADNSDYCW
ncbi:MAG: prepilin-type N-terminal cleavage/methylation domain-containing protein [Gammaproteobacteria bacterium]|nr:prepilin-type N-terminal cleavage/methylation domain-containing protein [Gammaproteobacteria bacterium]